MCVRASRPHLGRDPNGLHQLLARGAVAECRFRVSPDAIRALRDVCHRNSDQLLGLRGKRAASEDLLTENLKGFLRVGSERPPLFGEFPRPRGVEGTQSFQHSSSFAPKMEPLSTVTNAHHIFTQQSLLIFDFFEKRLERIARVEYAELQKSGATLKRRCWPSMLRACNLALAPRCDPALDAKSAFPSVRRANVRYHRLHRCLARRCAEIRPRPLRDRRQVRLVPQALPQVAYRRRLRPDRQRAARRSKASPKSPRCRRSSRRDGS